MSGKLALKARKETVMIATHRSYTKNMREIHLPLCIRSLPNFDEMQHAIQSTNAREYVRLGAALCLSFCSMLLWCERLSLPSSVANPAELGSVFFSVHKKAMRP